jgi:hypothetical protein
VKVISSEAASAFIADHGGRAWVWIDPHAGLGAVSYVYLVGAVEPPGASRATKRMRSARLPHRFTSHEAEGFDVLCSFGRYGEPEELHLELARFPRRHLKAYWNGAVFVGDDIPPMGER